MEEPLNQVFGLHTRKRNIHILDTVDKHICSFLYLELINLFLLLGQLDLICDTQLILELDFQNIDLILQQFHLLNSTSLCLRDLFVLLESVLALFHLDHLYVLFFNFGYELAHLSLFINQLDIGFSEVDFTDRWINILRTEILGLAF